MQERPCNSDPLLLPAGQRIAQFSDFCVISFRQRHDEIVDRRLFRGFHDFFPCRAGFSHGNVIGNGIMKQYRLLGHIGFHPPQIRGIDTPYIPSGNLHLAVLYVPEPHQQFQQGRFSGTAGSMDTDNFPFLNPDRIVL